MRALNIALALLCLLGLGHAASMIFQHVPLDPDEGWNAYRTEAAMTGGTLYPGGFVFNNYPPLSFYAVGLLPGDPIFAGRIVALLSLLAAAACIFASARRLGAKSEAAVFGALWFVAGLLVFTDYVAMDDPQLLGHAVAMGGLLLLLRGNVVGAALAMTTALFVKHNLVALPLAASLWLMLEDRRSALRFLVTAVTAGVVGLALFWLCFGKGLWSELNSPRLYSFAMVESGVASWLAWGGPALIATGAVLFVSRERFVPAYALVAVLLGAFFAGGAGVDMNAWFDAAIAVSLGAALALTRLPSRMWHAPALAAALLAPFVLGFDSDRFETPEPADGDIAFLQAREGSAICEMPSLCYWARKPEEVDVFNLGQAFATGAQSDEALVRAIKARRYAVLQLDSWDSFTPRVRKALERFYRLDHENDNGLFLVRRF